MICFCCNIKTDQVTLIEGLLVCFSCLEETFIIYDSYLDVFAVYPEGKIKEYSAMREDAKRYLDEFSARREINTDLSGHKRFKILRYNFEKTPICD